MALDAFANFAISSLTAGITAGATSLTVTTGEGTKFPAAPFNATIWDSTTFSSAYLDPSAEIVRVTLIAGDVLTITRAQEGTAAAAHNTGGSTYKVFAGVTALNMNKATDKTGDVFTGEMQFLKGLGVGTFVSKTSLYTATNADFIVFCDSTGGTFVVNLPLAASVKPGHEIIVYNKGSANQVTVTGAAADTIQRGTANAATLAIVTGQARSFYADGVSLWASV